MSSSSSSLVRLVVASQSNYRHVVGLVCDRICAMEHPWLFYSNVSKQKNLPCETLALTIAKRFRSIAFPCCIYYRQWPSNQPTSGMGVWLFLAYRFYRTNNIRPTFHSLARTARRIPESLVKTSLLCYRSLLVFELLRSCFPSRLEFCN